MARYFYAWIPLVALSAVLLFIVPFLGLIVAAVFAAGAVAAFGALAWRIGAALRQFVGFVLRRRGGAAQREDVVPAIPVLHEHAQPTLIAQAHAATVQRQS